MKKTILLLALMFIGMISHAQNFLGKSLLEVQSILDAKSIAYEGYVNQNNLYTIKYETETEERMYVFNYSDKCDRYYIIFTDNELIYQYGKILTKQGFVLQKTESEKIEWHFKKGKQEAICYYNENEYKYFIYFE